MNGHGFRWTRVKTSRTVICNSGTSANLELTAKSSTAIMNLKRKYDKAIEDHKQLRLGTETAILNLGTHARIKENFPLAAPMLPPPMSNALVCNFDSLTKRLQKQPDVKPKVTAEK